MRRRTRQKIVYAPARGLLYFGACGLGAWRSASFVLPPEDAPFAAYAARAVALPCVRKEPGAEFVVVASRSHMSAETEACIESLRRGHGAVRTVSVGSSLKFCLVAEGTADAYPRFGPTMEWDTAAGHAVVRAAGREVWQAGRELPLRYNKEDLLNPYFIAR